MWCGIAIPLTHATTHVNIMAPGRGLIALICHLWTWQRCGKGRAQESKGINNDWLQGRVLNLDITIRWTVQLYKFTEAQVYPYNRWTWCINYASVEVLKQSRRILETFGRQWLVCVCARLRVHTCIHMYTCACSQERKHIWEMGLNLSAVGKHRHFAGPESGSTIC